MRRAQVKVEVHRAVAIVHDWDSLAWHTEAAIVGAASGAFASVETPTLAPAESSAAFLDHYESCRGRRFNADEVQIAWAASLWLATWNARGQALSNDYL
jgi:hypothetical protein